MTTDTDMDLTPSELADDSATEHRELLQREVDRITAEIGQAREARTAANDKIRRLVAQRTPLERAVRAMTPRPPRD